MIRDLLLSIILVLFLTSCRDSNNNFEIILPSPDAQTQLYFNLNDGEPYYLIIHKNEIIIDWSLLGFIIDDSINFNQGLKCYKVDSRTASQKNEEFLLDIETHLENYNEISVYLEKSEYTDIQFEIVFRVYNNATSYKYIFSDVKSTKQLNEVTELDLYDDVFKLVEVRDAIYNDESLSKLAIEKVDTLSLPATFVSGKGLEIKYIQPVSMGYPSPKLVRRESDKPEYKLVYSSINAGSVNITSGDETPWRMIYISNNLK